MGPADALAWELVLGVACATLIGVAASSTAIRSSWLRKTIHLNNVLFLLIGVVALSAAKWTEIAVKVGDYEAKITGLEQQIDDQKVKIAKYQSVESDIVQFTSMVFGDAGKYLAAADALSKKDGWVTALLPNPENVKVSVSAEELLSSGLIGAFQSNNAAEFKAALEKSGYKILAPATPKLLGETNAEGIWYTPKNTAAN